MSVKFQLRGLDKATDQVRAAMIRGARNGLQVAGERAVGYVRENIRAAFGGEGPRLAYGLLNSSITTELRLEEGLFGRQVVFAQPPADVYAGVIELGRRPGRKFPPPDAIRLWLGSPKMRAIVQTFAAELAAKARRRKGRKQGIANFQERAEKALSFLIGRKIAVQGFPGHLMFARAEAILEPELGGIILGQVDAQLGAEGLK